MNRYRIGTDGRTPEQRRVGKKWKRPGVEFGEVCFFKPTSTTVNTRQKGADDRMKKGIFVGHHDRTGAVMMLTPDGLRRGIGLTRAPPSQRFDAEFMDTCRGLPWDPRPAIKEQEDGDSPEVVEKTIVKVVQMPGGGTTTTPARRRYLTTADVQRYG